MTMNNPLFSIIIPVYNRESLVSQTLESIKRQMYRPIQVVVVDDGSTDKTADTIKKWMRDNQELAQLEIQYVYQKNSGVASARNRGFVESKGKYIYFLDSDDRIYPDALEKVSRTFQVEGADLILTGYNIFDEETDLIVSEIHGYSDKRQLEHVIKGEVCVVTLRSFFSRSLVKKTGRWNENMKMSEDTEFIQRALCLSKKSVGIKDITAGLRRGGRDHRSFDFDQTCRVYCNEIFLSNVLDKQDVPITMKRLLVSKMAQLSCKLRLMGEISLAKRCAFTASSTDIKMTPSLRLRLLLCHTGLPGSVLFAALYRVRSFL